MAWKSYHEFSGPLPESAKFVAGDSTDMPNEYDRGCLVFEADLSDQDNSQTVLVETQMRDRDDMSISVKANKSGAVIVRLQTKGQETKVRTGPHNADGIQPFRASFSWVSGNCALKVEHLHSSSTAVATAQLSSPIPSADILALISPANHVNVDPALRYIAFSDQPDALQSAPTIEANSPIETPEGWRAVGKIRPGDLVITDDGGPEIVRKILSQSVPAIGSLRPLRLRAPFYGLTEDILVSQSQMMLIDDELAEYLFGEEQVIVNAGMMADGSSIYSDRRIDILTYCQVHLDRHAILNVGGLGLTSHFCPVGDVGAGVPAHKELACPVLRPYEALTLKSFRQ